MASRAIIAILILISLCAAQEKERPSLVSPAGEVTLNGVALNRVNSIYTEDVLLTGSNSGVNISYPGSTLVLSQDSCLAYGSGLSVLECGSVTVTTRVGFSVAVCSLTVWPAVNDRGRYEVRLGQDGVRVTALSGSISVSDGTNTTTLTTGKSKVTKQPDCLPASSLTQKREAAAKP